MDAIYMPTEVLRELEGQDVILSLNTAQQMIQMPISLGKNSQGKEVTVPGQKSLPEQVEGTLVSVNETYVKFRMKGANHTRYFPVRAICDVTVLSKLASVSSIVT